MRKPVRAARAGDCDERGQGHADQERLRVLTRLSFIATCCQSTPQSTPHLCGSGLAHADFSPSPASTADRPAPPKQGWLVYPMRLLANLVVALRLHQLLLIFRGELRPVNGERDLVDLAGKGERRLVVLVAHPSQCIRADVEALVPFPISREASMTSNGTMVELSQNFIDLLAAPRAAPPGH